MRKLKSEKLVICPRSNTKFIVFQKMIAVIKGIYEKLYENFNLSPLPQKKSNCSNYVHTSIKERSLGIAHMHIKCIWNDIMEIIQIMDSEYVSLILKSRLHLKLLS